MLVNPGFPISTGQAYRRLDDVRREVLPLPESLKAIEHATSVSWSRIVARMENDFESALFGDYPVLADVKNTLLALGAEGALLSGSGATVFGVFREQAEALRAKEAFTGNTEYEVAVGPSLHRGMLEQALEAGTSSPDGRSCW